MLLGKLGLGGWIWEIVRTWDMVGGVRNKEEGRHKNLGVARGWSGLRP